MPTEPATRTDREGVRDRSGSRLMRAVRFVRERGLVETWQLARAHGWSGSAHFVHRNLRYVLATWCDRAFDATHGVETSGDVPAAYLDAASAHASLGHQFISTSVRSFNAIMKLLPADVSGFSFVDIGSGKGRTLLLAARFPFRSVIGIEYAASLVQIANANVPSYRGNPPLLSAIESICADATTASYPEVPLIIYLFNPFEIEIFEKVFARIVESYQAAPRPILLIYVSGEKSVLERVSDLVVGSNLFESQLEKQLPFYLRRPVATAMRDILHQGSGATKGLVRAWHFPTRDASPRRGPLRAGRYPRTARRPR